ncbi:uncharacterized protein BKA78DRAFT_72398 [Phyllosticta capitalensis]|uniref:uncharacterized protein n=1 Tax=Phyllosticta capitalensis TaxID=121624 RepID=UPI00313261CC
MRTVSSLSADGRLGWISTLSILLGEPFQMNRGEHDSIPLLTFSAFRTIQPTSCFTERYGLRCWCENGLSIERTSAPIPRTRDLADTTSKLPTGPQLKHQITSSFADSRDGVEPMTMLEQWRGAPLHQGPVCDQHRRQTDQRHLQFLFPLRENPRMILRFSSLHQSVFTRLPIAHRGPPSENP